MVAANMPELEAGVAAIDTEFGNWGQRAISKHIRNVSQEIALCPQFPGVPTEKGNHVMRFPFSLLSCLL